MRRRQGAASQTFSVVGSPLLLHRRDLIEQLQQGVLHSWRRVNGQVAGKSSPGLVSAQSMLFGRGQVAVVAVGQLHDERRLERAVSFDRQSDFDKRLARRANDSQVADTNRLKLDGNCRRLE